MTSNAIGILAAFAEPVLHAWVNILDHYFSNRLFKRLTPLVFFSSLIGLALLPIVWWLDPPTRISWTTALILVAVAALEVVYLYPYYSALRHADTSVVASLFSMGKIFVPALAFLFVGERLTSEQYAGFLLITGASILLALDFRKMRFNRAFGLMLGVSAMLAVQSVLLKRLYTSGVSWGTSIAWMIGFQFLMSLALILQPKRFAEAKKSLGTFKSFGGLLVGTEILNWGGLLASSYGLSLIPVSVTKGIAGTQPIFVLTYALLFAKIWPKVFKEYLGKEGVVKKAILFVVTLIGAWLIVEM